MKDSKDVELGDLLNDIDLPMNENRDLQIAGAWHQWEGNPTMGAMTIRIWPLPEAVRNDLGILLAETAQKFLEENHVIQEGSKEEIIMPGKRNLQ